jgi:UDP:flavonoid glycosyltransferase YjiC (YdhE family)
MTSPTKPSQSSIEALEALAENPRGKRRLKVMMFPLGYLLAHVTRLVEVAHALQARGHEVVFVGEDPANPRSRLGFAERSGFRLIRGMEPNHAFAWDRFEKYGWPITAWDLLTLHRWAPLDKILDNHVGIIKQERPDLIMGDASITVSTAGYITGVPACGVMNGYNTKFMEPWSPFLPMIHAWDALHLQWLRRPVYRKHGVAPANAVRLMQSMPMMSPDLDSLYEEPKYWRSFHTIGPIVHDLPCEIPDWFSELDDGKTNVYITMGTTGLLDRFLRKAYEPLSKLPYRFLVTTGGQASDETVAMAPPNFRMSKYAPGMELMSKSQALIYHGGNGTMYQALAHGVPMIVLPSHLEQELSARIAVKHGFGLRMSPRRLRPEKLVRKLDLILREPRFREAAERYSQPTRASRGAERAADLAEQLAFHGTTPPSRKVFSVHVQHDRTVDDSTAELPSE